MANQYSPTWFDLFLAQVPASQTEAEVAFLCRWLPQPQYTSILDLCCGYGRHAIALAERGYAVTGLDRDPAVLAKAEGLSHGKVRFVQGDLRELAGLDGAFDAVVSLWQSFGYFDDGTNTGVLNQISQKLAPQGRLVLHVYHRECFVQSQGKRKFERGGAQIVETKSMRGNRLTVRLDYDCGKPPDVFEWQLYSPEEIRGLARPLGLDCVLTCTGFDERMAAVPTSPRMQLVLEKRA